MILRKNSHDFNLKQVKKYAIICQISYFLRDLADYMNFLTMVTTYGVRQNSHSGIVQSEVTLDDLFS